MRASHLIPIFGGGLIITACLFAPVDSRLDSQNPTYPDGGGIPDGGGTVDNQTGAGVLSNVGISGSVSNGVTYAPGVTLSASASAFDSRGSAVENVSYQWGLSSNAASFTSGQNGASVEFQTQAVSSPTSVTLTVQVTQNGRSASSSITFTVQATQDNVITEIRIGGAPENLIVGQSVQELYVQGFNAAGMVVQTITSLDSWVSSNSNIVQVQQTDSAHARVTGAGAGTATIQALVGSFTSPAVTIVSKQPYISLSQQCSPSGTQTISVGGDLTLYSMTYDGSTCETLNTFWQSSDTNKVTVSPAQGTSTVVHGVANGQTSVTANFSGVIVSLQVNVSAPVNNGHIVRVVQSAPHCEDITAQVTVAPSTQFLVAAVTGDAGGCNYSSNYFFTWTTDNEQVATVSPQMAGSNFATVSIPAGATTKTTIHVTGTGDGGTFQGDLQIYIGAE